MSIIYLTNDLMFSSRVSAAAHAAATDMHVTGDVSELPALLPGGAVRLVILDLNLPSLDLAAVLPSIREAAPDVVVIAYGPHVHEQKLAAARAAGCNQVLSKGEFNASASELIARYAVPT